MLLREKVWLELTPIRLTNIPRMNLSKAVKKTPFHVRYRNVLLQKLIISVLRHITYYILINFHINL